MSIWLCTSLIFLGLVGCCFAVIGLYWSLAKITVLASRGRWDMDDVAFSLILGTLGLGLLALIVKTCYELALKVCG